MPFGPYSDFQDCVSKNGDKSSPEGFCAWMEHQITGSWPGQMKMLEGMPEDIKALFLERFSSVMKAGKGEIVALATAHKAVTDAGWAKKNSQWRKYQAMPTKTIRDVEIFAAGEHNGDVYSQDDLDGIIDAFYKLRGRVDPPVKIGHSSDEFNQEIAKKLGIPKGMITGEGGEGALAFGWVDNLRRYDDILVADFVNVPEPIVDLIESKLYRHVSCELSADYNDDGNVYPYVLSAIALLGAEQQAVSEIKGLDMAMVYAVNSRANSKKYDYERKGAKLTNEEKSFWADVLAKLKKLIGMEGDKGEDDEDEEDEDKKKRREQEAKEADMLKEINKALGIAEDAKVEAAVAEIAKLKSNPDVKKFSDLQVEIKSFKDRAEVAEAKIKTQDREARVAKYAAIAKSWTSIAGQPEDMAERIVVLEDLDVKAAEGLVKIYTGMNAAAVAAGITKPIGTGASATGESEFEKAVKQISEEKDSEGRKRYKTKAEAFRAATEQFTELYKEYRVEQLKSKVKEV